MILTHRLGNQKPIAEYISKTGKTFYVFITNDYVINAIIDKVYYTDNISDLINFLGDSTDGVQ